LVSPRLLMKNTTQKTSAKSKKKGNRSIRFMPIALAGLHVIFSPILGLSFVLINLLLALAVMVITIVIAVKLLKADQKFYLMVIRIHKYLLIFYAVLGAYGIFAILMNVLSAARGGGLFGGLGEAIVGLAIILTMFSLLNIVLLKKSLKK